MNNLSFFRSSSIGYKLYLLPTAVTTHQITRIQKTVSGQTLICP